MRSLRTRPARSSTARHPGGRSRRRPTGCRPARGRRDRPSRSTAPRRRRRGSELWRDVLAQYHRSTGTSLGGGGGGPRSLVTHHLAFVIRSPLVPLLPPFPPVQASCWYCLADASAHGQRTTDKGHAQRATTARISERTIHRHARSPVDNLCRRPPVVAGLPTEPPTATARSPPRRAKGLYKQKEGKIADFEGKVAARGTPATLLSCDLAPTPLDLRRRPYLSSPFIPKHQPTNPPAHHFPNTLPTTATPTWPRFRPSLPKTRRAQLGQLG